VSSRPDEGIEARGDVRMGVQVLPEWQPEDLVVRGLPCPDVGGEGSPGVGETAADAVEVKAEALRRVAQPLGDFVQHEPAGRRFLKHAFPGEVGKHPVQGVGVAVGRRGKLLDVGGARGHALGDSQRGHHMDAPRSA